ncbi:MAG: hypothetical protein D6740_00810 [Alphaproteobacteria bacterium]|nr:MAG: hypothetical protein D6740_00810 [Alphaproteobacteria bacterium]
MLDRGPKDRVFHARTAVTTATPDGGVRVRVTERRPAVLPVAEPADSGAEPLFAPNVEPVHEAVEMIRARAAFAAAARLISAESERGDRLLDILDDGRADRRG